ncbi:c-type cytochrome [Candidatus Ornithobacterium hominis]|uniref:c-type cytochrome n=1 Tax=Candidatus Ornithobacterium hominis TaxID=2497989 RepID=UPI0024BC6C04|nr:c-type cytochrome [Candidatus Ornithobacterium hominis]
MIIWGNFKLKQMASALLIVLFSVSFAQEAEVNGDPAKGESLYNANCAACHALDKRMVGPALGGILERLQQEQGLGRDWLHSWIKDNAALRESGDEYAIEVYEEYNQIAMMPFPQLSEQDIDDILAYTSKPSAEEEEKVEDAAVAAAVDKKEDSDGASTGVILIGFAVISVLLIWILFRVNYLYKLTAEEAILGEAEAELFSLKKSFEKYSKFAYSLMGVLSLFVLYALWNIMLAVGVDKGYQPEQPIYFSHKIHAGEQGIDCQMCHTSAKYGKVSGIPTTNVCMNCHYQIQEYKGEYIEEGKSKDFYTKEIQKIYVSAGFNPQDLTYNEDSKPIEWTRIHNMPDFVYFNHAQHVVAGEQAIKDAKNVEQVCFACHGRVDQMDEVRMEKDFTMGWCIECHRATEVDMNNEYNKEYYAQLHEKLKKEYGKQATITVDAIGGLECGKCHY